MRKIQLTLLILSLLSITSLLFAGGFALSGVGSRATAMAGAFRGLSDDATAMYWNPAGLGFMEGNSLDVGGTFILPSSTWEAGAMYAAIPGFGTGEFEAEKKLRSFPNAFLTMAKHPKLKYGLGVFVPYGLGTTWDIYKLPPAHPVYGPLGYAAGFPEDEMKSSIAILDVHPSVAYQIMPNLSAGAGISVFYGSIELGKVSLTKTSAADTLNNYIFQPFSSDMSGSGIGFGANLGMLFKPTPCLSLGLTGKLPATISMKGDAEIYRWIPTPMVPAAMQVGGKSDIETDLNLPGELGLGISYKVKPNWALNLDYAYTMWSALDEVVIEMDEPIPTLGITESVVTFNWEDTHRISLGTEYLMNNNAFRAGMYYDQTPIPKETQTPTLSDVGNKISANLGYGRSFGKFSFDVNAQYVMFSEREVESISLDAQNSPTNMTGTYNSNSISGIIGLGYRF
ncbi:MAG: outer membrane protein transport protein [Candidatus Cloacimonetes bacterium]|nr:outer membrane protein transport protein [Candidatus Cloacimonadota bacterium]